MNPKQEEQEIAKDGVVDSSKLSEVITDAVNIARLREDIAEQFNLDKLKGEYKKKILDSKEFRSDNNLTDADADLAAQKYVDNFYEFKPIENPDSLSTKLARSYVRVYKNRRKYGFSILATASVVGFLWTGFVAANSIQSKLAEKNVETAVEENYRAKENLKNQISSLQSNQSLLKDTDQLVAIIRSSSDDLNRTNDFFEKYCDEGVADDKVTPNNYSEAKQNLQSVEEILSSAKGKVGQGEGLVRLEQDLISTKQSLDSLIKEIESSTPPKVLMNKASTVYNSGIASLENRQLNEARQYRDQLREVKNNVKEFETLPSTLEQLYSSVKQIAVEREAVQQADKWHKDGLTYVANVDVKSLKTVISGLEDLSTNLKQEYTVRVVSRERVRSGVERGYENRPSNYYVVVEAVDVNGNVLPKSITNEENGNTETVSMWGERVTVAAYEQVKQDKMDDGIIQNNIFAKKLKGYLSEELVMQGITTRGQITSW